jgi:hypothetical protein
VPRCAVLRHVRLSSHSSAVCSFRLCLVLAICADTAPLPPPPHPTPQAIVEVPETYVGGVVELFAQRKGEMQDMEPSLEGTTK